MRILGRFSKGIPGSYSLNFGLPGGKYCSSLCNYKDRVCYGLRISKLYPSAQKGWQNLENTKPVEILNRAIKEVRFRLNKIKWFRFNVVGSLPHVNQRGPAFNKKLIELVKLLQKNNIPIHLPVETINKHKFYSKLLQRQGVAVRLSCNNKRQWENFPYTCSILAGSIGDKVGTRVSKAKTLKDMRQKKYPNRQIILCPGILTNKLLFPNSKGKIKCGQCQECSKKNVDVIYILH